MPTSCDWSLAIGRLAYTTLIIKYARKLWPIVCKLYYMVWLENTRRILLARTIFNNLHVAGSVLDCCSARFRRVAMLQNDFEKAFDRVNRLFLFRVLSHIGCGSIICEGINVAYAGCFTRLFINSSFASPIPIYTSVRQRWATFFHFYFLFTSSLFVWVMSIVELCVASVFEKPKLKYWGMPMTFQFLCIDREGVFTAASSTKRFCISARRIRTCANAIWRDCSGFCTLGLSWGTPIELPGQQKLLVESIWNLAADRL